MSTQNCVEVQTALFFLFSFKNGKVTWNIHDYINVSEQVEKHKWGWIQVTTAAIHTSDICGEAV